MRCNNLTIRRLLLLVALAAGCGTTEQPKKPSAGTESSADVVLRMDVATLPPVGDPLPPLDQGRLELSGPRGWVLPPRDKQWLVRFQTQPDVAYPTILVTGADAIGIDALNSKNVRDFADRTQTSLDEELRPLGQRLLTPVAPLRIGDRYWIEYARSAKAGDTRLERLFLVTVVAGREYTVELRTHIGSLAKRRPEALAVAASLRTSKAADSPVEAAAPASAPPETANPAAP